VDGPRADRIVDAEVLEEVGGEDDDDPGDRAQDARPGGGR
jgi:hypothetical protein